MYIKRLMLFLIWFIPVLSIAQTQSLEERADSLFNRHQEKEALQVYKEIVNTNPSNFTALWRSSLLYSRVGNRLESEDEQREYFTKAKDLAERALQRDSTDAESNFAMAVAMGRMALISGARDRVAASREIKRYADLALKYDPRHAGAWHVLGRWNFKIANLSFVERLAANTLFGGIPGDASNEKAAEYIEKAINLDDKFMLYHYDLATVYREMGQTQKAINTCRTVMNMTPSFPDDPGLQDQCRDLLEDLE